MNVILIVIDAVRAKELGCYGGSDQISPNIDRLAKEGVLFENAYCCVNATDPSLTTIFTGQYPIHHGILKHGPQIEKDEIQSFFKNNPKTISTILKSQGYITLAVDWLGRWHRIGYDYYTGIVKENSNLSGETQEYKESGNLQRYLVSKLQRFPRLFRLAKTFNYKILRKRAKEESPALIFGDADTVTNKAKKLIHENRDKDFFIFVHYWDTHSPYYCPSSYAKRYYNPADDKNTEEIAKEIKNPERRDVIKNLGTSVNEIIARYKGAIEFVDGKIGEIVEMLGDLDILDQTLLIVTSDHGESLTEHGIYFDHHGLYDPEIRVPLILKHPNIKNKRIEGFVQHIDILPTILDILGLQIKGEFDGKSLLPLINGEVSEIRNRDFVFVEEAHTQRKMSIRTTKYKYIKSLSKQEAICKYCGIIHGGLEELYDLECDPGETKNIINDYPEVAKVMSEKISDFIISIKNKKHQREIKRKKIKHLKTTKKI